jgi:hypothetical protein
MRKVLGQAEAMMLRKSILGAAGLLTVAGSLSFHGCSSEDSHDLGSEQDENSATGGVNLALTLPSGIVINSVMYTVSGGPGAVNETKTVDVTNSSVLKFQVGNLPVGSGYTISLAASTAGGQSCGASAPFAVTSNLNTSLSMTLTCGNSATSNDNDDAGDLNVNVDVTQTASTTCPVVTGLSALPLETAGGSSLALEGFASSTTGVTFAWTGPGGTFTAPAALASNFICQGAGNRTLTLTLSKSGCAPANSTVDVTCSARFSSSSAYLVPVASGVTTKAILSAGDAVGTKPDGSLYRMVGIPDGLGAFDNGDGTFTMLSNHELGSATTGIPRAHGGRGAFVSRWTIRKSDYGVLGGQDLMQTVQLWNPTTSTYGAGTNVGFGRFCSADLAPVSAWFAGGTGYNGQLFMDGEEIGAEGRAMGHELSGTSWELPRLGKASWENLIASPFAQAKTIVAGDDDSTPGQVYIYVGTKTNTGSPIERAGLSNGTLYGIAVTGFPTEPSATGIPAGTAFTLANLGNVQNSTGATLETQSTAANVTRFNRPEDGAWDPMHPNDYYFVTTNAINAPSRLWRARFTDIANPELGGTIESVLNGSEGQLMLDNIAIDARGHIMLVEDVGNDPHIGQVFRYNIASDTLTTVAQHDPDRFMPGAAHFLTQDEEASGIIDATAILGAGYWLVDVQAHYTFAEPVAPNAEIIEGGQYIVLYDPASL